MYFLRNKSKFLKRWKNRKKNRKKIEKESEICHGCTSASASAISDCFALALTSLKKSCALARAHQLTSARSERCSNERRSPKLWLSMMVECPLSEGNQAAHPKFERGNGKNTKSKIFLKSVKNWCLQLT